MRRDLSRPRMNDESDTQRKRSGYRTLIGYRTKVWREGYGEVELVVGPQHLNSIGIVHGGVYASLLDVALGHAVSFCPVPGHARYSTTVSLTTTFLKSADAGVLTAMGRVEGISGPPGDGLGRGARRDRRAAGRGAGQLPLFPGQRTARRRAEALSARGSRSGPSASSCPTPRAAKAG